MVPSSGHDSCQGAQHDQELFWYIKACPNLRRMLGSFGNPLLTAQLMILALGLTMGVCFPSTAVILLGAVDRDVVLVWYSPRARQASAGAAASEAAVL